MQKSVALSSAEAEYYSALEMAIEIIYLRGIVVMAPTPNMARGSKYHAVKVLADVKNV